MASNERAVQKSSHHESREENPQKAPRKALLDFNHDTWKQICISIDPASAANKATGIVIMPTRKKSQKLTSIFSRRSAISQRIVANDPVIERFGPKSTPMRTAFAIESVACDACTVLPAIRPSGR